MRIFDYRHIGLAVAATLALTLASTPSVADEVTARLDIDFAGSSTLHGFQGTAAELTVPVTLQPGDVDRWSAEVDVPVATLDTGNRKRDENMRAMLDAEHFPTLRGVLRDLDPDAVHASGKLPLRLVIRDVERDMIADVSDWRAGRDEVSFDASFEISLREFGLEAPHFLFVRVSDRVTVALHATIRRP